MDESADEKRNNIKSTFSTARRAIAFSYKNQPRLTILAFVLGVVLAAIVFIQAASFSSIVNEIIRIKDTGEGISQALIFQSLFLGMSFLIPAILQNLESKIINELSSRFVTALEVWQIDSYSSLDIGTVEGEEFQKKIQYASKWGTGSIWNSFYYSKNVLADMAGFITSGIFLGLISPYLILLAVIGALPYYFIENTFGLKFFRLYHLWTDETRISADRISYFKEPKKLVEVILFNIAGFFRDEVKKNSDTYDNQVISLAARQSKAKFWADFLQMACLFIAIFLVTIATLRGALLVGSLFLAFTAYRGFVSTSQSFFLNFSKLEEQTRFAKRWFDIFDVKPKVMSKPNAVQPSWDTPPSIEFKNVSFAYPSTDVVILKNVSLTIKSSEKLAIVGQNGAGKTTLIKLLCRVYDPTEGSVLIDGIDLKDIDLQHWHSYLGVLFQDFSNYNLTVKQSIAIGRSDKPIDEERVRWAAEMTDASEFIENLPRKYDQLLWKGFKDGVELSKGQFQRMAVARIFYRNALISVLDEPTSAIDAVAEEKIFEVLEKKMEGKTVVLISHRFSTVKNADKIAVIEHGELKELGSHKELMAKNGRYQELFSMQANRYLETDN